MIDQRARDAIEYLQEQVNQLERRLRDLKMSANSIASAAGLPRVYDVDQSLVFDRPPPSIPFEKPVQPQQFAQFDSPSVAARAFLAWRGKSFGAVTLDEICDALFRGGFPGARTDDDAKLALRFSLGRDPEIGRLKNGYYILASWAKRDHTKTPTSARAPRGK